MEVRYTLANVYKITVIVNLPNVILAFKANQCDVFVKVILKQKLLAKCSYCTISSSFEISLIQICSLTICKTNKCI